MSRNTLPVAALFTALALVATTFVPAAAPAAVRPARHQPAPAIRLLAPGPGERVAQPIGRLEVAVASGHSDVRIVVSRERFDPSGWTALPTGAAWCIGAPGATELRLAELSLPAPTETALWWTAIARDVRTGALHAGEVRRFVLVPSFANRSAAPVGATPSAAGWLPPRAAAPAHRAFALASGRALEPATSAERSTPAAAAAPAGTGGRRACLVQFTDDEPDSARARIEHAGGAVVAPISGEAWLVRADDAARNRIAAAGGAPWIDDWRPGDKVSPLVDRGASVPQALTALLFADGDESATVAALAALGASDVHLHHGSVNHLVRFRLDPARVADAAALPDLAWIEPTPVYTASNDSAQWVTQTGVVNSRRLWDHGLYGQGQVIMDADSGVRPDHDMFVDSLVAITGWGNYPTHRKIIAYLPGSDDPRIEFGDDVASSYHGTHTSGTLVGNPDAISGAPWSGMAKQAKLWMMDMSGPSLASGLAPPADLNDLFQPSYTGNAGGAARLSSNSWGNSSSQGAYLLESMQVDQFMWSHPDYLVSFAAGNVGTYGTIEAPGTAKDCITVGAVQNGTLENQLAPFTSRGPTSDLRWKPTTMGPGMFVTSSIGSTRHMYAAYEGTSMATPAVTGTIALMREYLTEGWYPTGTPVAANAFAPSAALLKAMVVNASRNDVLGSTVPSYTIGWGRMTADDVLYFPGDSSRTLLVDGTAGLLDRQYVEYQVQVTDPTRPLKVALCWTDAPGNPASAVQLVNDLDLVVSNGATTYLGNYWLAGKSATGGRRDSLNVEEAVRVPTPAAGVWTVRVEAHRVLQGPQPFALCVTGGVNAGGATVALDRFEYGLVDTLGIEVTDVGVTGPLQVRVHSNTEPNDEPVTLTGGNGVFRGRIPVAPVVYRPVDGVLSVSEGDVVTVTYADRATGTAVVASAPVHASAPVISDVRATALSSTSALVTWTTDLFSTSRVRFGSGALGSVADSSGLGSHHAVLLTGLAVGATYRYDVESATRTGALSVDSLGGQYRQFTTRARGQLALVMDDPSASTLATWTNALGALGWTADVFTGAQVDPPLVGDATTGLRSYPVVMWQVDPDRYPAFSDAQRLAIDSLLTGGGRLLVTGHDIAYSLSDADVASYSPEREAWLEGRLKTLFLNDLSWADTLRGVAGDPATGDFAAGVKYHPELYPDAGDEVQFAVNHEVTGRLDWLDDGVPAGAVGLRWETLAPQGTAGTGVWGGKSSRFVGLYYEWTAVGSASTASDARRTAVLERSVEWLLGHKPPQVHLAEPLPGAVVTSDYLTIRYVTAPDSGRTIANRSLAYSLDGGDSWSTLANPAWPDSGWAWDLAGALGGTPVPNSPRVLLRLRALDDGSPPLADEVTLAGTITLARAAGDTHGPVLVAGSVGTSPNPLKRGSAATLTAVMSDAETGGGTVAAAEYSLGATPAAAGAGRAMSGTFGTPSVTVSAALNTSEFVAGTQALWVRGRDGAGNWGPAAMLTVIANDLGVLAVREGAPVDFLAPASPNPSLGTATLRFGTQRAGEVRLELFDVAGRRVRTLIAGRMDSGPHAVAWDGRDDGARRVGAGVYFLRLVTPTRTYDTRLVRLD